MDLEDFIVSNNLLPLGSLVYLAFCTSRYGWGFKKFLAEADEGRGIKFPAWARIYNFLRNSGNCTVYLHSGILAKFAPMFNEIGIK